MLEKEAENANFAKLRVILLLEVYFNGLNKIVFDNRVLLILEKE